MYSMPEMLAKSGLIFAMLRGLKDGMFSDGMPSLRCCLMHSAVSVISAVERSLPENKCQDVNLATLRPQYR